MNKTYDKLIEKLDAFTRKYYLNQIIRGAIYFVAIGLAAFLLSAVLEYFGRFSSSVRTALFFGLVFTFAALFISFILIPAFKLARMGKLISHDEASRMIGNHFPNISDKLLNTLQLKRQAELSTSDSSLLIASIDQRIEELQPVPFVAAVNFGENRKYLKYVIPPIVLAIILLVVSPSILKDGSQRIVSYNVDYIPEAPFDFIIVNDSLKVALNEDYNLKVETNGTYAPSAMSVDLGGKLFRLKRNTDGTFSYTFKNVRNQVPFKLVADGFYSKNFILDVLPTPSVLNFTVDLSYPDYLKKPNETLSNTGNIRVPEGTRIGWKFSTRNAEELYMAFTDSAFKLEPREAQKFNYQRKVTSNQIYRVAALNTIVGGKDTIDYRIDVLKDAYPRIQVRETRDSTDKERIYFAGGVSDDYGITRLNFYYSVRNSSGEERNEVDKITLTGQAAQEFFHFKDFSAIGLQPGDEIDYYFEVWDNDGVNGAKSTRSTRKSFKAPSLDELDKERKESSESVKDKIEQSIKDAAELQKELGKLNKDLLQKKDMSWQDKKRIEDLLKKQKELEKNVNQLKEERKNTQQNQEKYMQQSESIMQKQQQLEKMFNELMSEEMKEMYKKLEELMKQFDQEKIREELEKMEMTNEELEKELDRTLEIFKQLEFEQEFEKTLDKLEELAKKQEELSKETKDGDKTKEELKEEQDKLNEEFEKLQEDLKDLEKQNEELERPNDMPDTEKMEEQIKEEMKSSSESLEKNKKSKASESQQGAAEKMKEMAQQMESAMSGSQSENAQEDMESLRALLENIIQLSFDQEAIMENLRVIEREDPKYVELGQKQKKLEDDSKMVEDSLFALSKRVVQIEAVVNREIGLVNQNIAKAIEDIGERKTADAASRQQYVMTSYNNLALLLDEALQQMQMQMSSQNPGKGNCNKPGGMGNKPSEGKMSKMQEAMGKKLEQMQKALEKGQKPGGKKPGMGGQGMSKEIAQMAAEQAAIRREIEKMAQKLNEQGKGEGKGLQDIAEKMEETERDLVNQEITRETFKRQQDILTRLLESEKAEREREYDNKRESNSPKPYEPSNPERYLEYNKRKAREIELLRTVPPDLKPYYKERVNDYFLNFED